MDDLNLNFREVLVKKPFFEIMPDGYMNHGGTFKAVNDNTVMPDDYLFKQIKTQQDFLREYYPTAHRIYDKKAYPDVVKINPDYDPEHPENGPRLCVQPITRTAFAFQQLIANKHILHLTGNDVQFEIAEGEDEDKTEKIQENLSVFKKGWLLANMEIRHYEAVRSLMIVADAAVVGYFDKGKFRAKTLSAMDGDKLYPHLDSITGELTLFARKYFDYDEDGTQKTEWVEVWDEHSLKRYKRGLKGNKLVASIKDFFGISGYELVSDEPHGFPFLPVAYTRNDEGPAWEAVQRNIEDYEEAFSYLSESNKGLAFPIFYIKGTDEEVSINGDMNGAVKSISMAGGKDNEAGFLNGTDASDAFATQLNKAYELIYELSFTVKPPELKSGDLPGVALKLLYSPAIEIAMNDAQRIQPFLDQLVKIAKFGIGYENNMQATMMELPINAWVEPYIHQNDTELVVNLAQAVQNGFLSKQTASERNSKFSKNDEFDRVLREKKEEQQQDLLIEIKKMDAQVEDTIEQEQAAARINRQNGSDINTGHGKKGRPNKSGKKWDKNGNNDIDDRNNWEEYNKYH